MTKISKHTKFVGVTATHKKTLLTKYLNSWESLNTSEKAFLILLNNTTNESTDAEALYYKINKYWILLHQMAHRYGGEGNTAIPKPLFGWKTEKIVDEKVLLFLADNGHLQKFSSFEKLVRKTNTLSRSSINSEDEIKKLEDFKQTNVNLIQLLYTRSKSMLMVYDNLRSNHIQDESK